jgi:hypothetical protein
MISDDMSCSKWDRPACHDEQVELEKGLGRHRKRTFEQHVIRILDPFGGLYAGTLAAVYQTDHMKSVEPFSNMLTNRL